MSTHSFEGGCQCGTVRYHITGAPRFNSACGCMSCRKQSGSAFGMSLRVLRSDFVLTKGEVKIWSRPADSGAMVDCAFCATCGTRVLHAPGSAPEYYHVKPGTLDDPDQFPPEYWSYTANSPTWVHIDDLKHTWPNQPDPNIRK